MARLSLLVAEFGEDVPYAGALANGFPFRGSRVPFLNYQKGIYRAKVQKGCAWCGGDLRPDTRPSTASYCSDACVQADHEGLDDIPPVVPCGNAAGMSEEAKSRWIERSNASYNEWAAGRRTP